MIKMIMGDATLLTAGQLGPFATNFSVEAAGYAQVSRKPKQPNFLARTLAVS